MPARVSSTTPRCVYTLCRNTGYDTANPDPLAPNAPDLSVPDPADSNYYCDQQVLNYNWVADNAPSGGGNDHRHHMPTPGVGQVSASINPDSHFHNAFVNNSGIYKWTTENLSSGGKAPHTHETDVMRIVNSLGEIAFIQRPKWVFILAKVNSWTHQHWLANGGGRTIMIAERPYVGGDDSNPNTWVFEPKANNVMWDAGELAQANNFFMSRFGLELPIDDGSGDVGVTNDRRFVMWWNSLNRYQFQDESRLG